MSDHNMHQATIERLEEAIARLSQGHTTLTQSHTAIDNKFTQSHTVMDSKFKSILDWLVALTVDPPPPKPPPNSPSPPVPQRPHMKLDVPKFDGQDPLGWIFKITQFFNYQCLPEVERLTVVGFYMEGPALSWYQWMYRNRFLTSWPTMLQALESRFSPSFFDDPQGVLFKLHQRCSVTEYLTEFEKLANRIVGLVPSLLLALLVFGMLG